MNPFQAQGLFVGRREHLAEIHGYLDGGTSALLMGGRRSGKTTLARNLADTIARRRVIFADVEGWDLSSEATALGGLYSAIKGRAATAYPRSTRDKVLSMLERKLPVTLILDEADLLLRHPWGRSFLSFLRYLDDSYLGTRISILLVGGPILGRFRDPDDRGSPPLNTAEATYIEPLDQAAVAELVSLVDQQRRPDVADVVRLAGGHALLTVKLLSAIYAGRSVEEANERVAQEVGHFEVWAQQLGEQGRTLVSRLPRDGVPLATWRTDRSWAAFRDIERQVRSIGATRVVDGQLCHGPTIFRDWLLGRSRPAFKWDIAISYVEHADEALARTVAKLLKDEFRVFFAADEDASLWANDLGTMLPEIYGSQSRYVLALCSPDYPERRWTRVEFEAITSRSSQRVLVVDLGGVPPELPDSVVYRSAGNADMVGLLDAIRAKLRMPEPDGLLT